MSNQEVKELVTYIFQKLETAETNSDIENIWNDSKVIKVKKNRMNEESYPQLNFEITAEELKNANFLSNDNKFSKDISALELSPLTKLLYAICWKNGDLKKVKPIVQGILSDENTIDDKDDGLVFYQFGKYLTKRVGEPIIDQHVLRAFSIFKTEESEDHIHQIRKKSTVTKKDLKLIKEYKTWLGTGLKEDLKRDKDYCYYIDQLLFALGKAIKVTAKSKIQKNKASTSI